MIRGNVFFEIEKIEQLALINRLTTHHDLRPSLKSFRRRNHDSPISTRTFSTASVKLGHPGNVPCTTVLPPKAEVHRRYRNVADVPIVFSNSGSGCQALHNVPCRVHCSLRSRGLPSA